MLNANHVVFISSIVVAVVLGYIVYRLNVRAANTDSINRRLVFAITLPLLVGSGSTLLDGKLAIWLLPSAFCIYVPAMIALFGIIKWVFVRIIGTNDGRITRLVVLLLVLFIIYQNFGNDIGKEISKIWETQTEVKAENADEPGFLQKIVFDAQAMVPNGATIVDLATTKSGEVPARLQPTPTVDASQPGMTVHCSIELKANNVSVREKPNLDGAVNFVIGINAGTLAATKVSQDSQGYFWYLTPFGWIRGDNLTECK